MTRANAFVLAALAFASGISSVAQAMPNNHTATPPMRAPEPHPTPLPIRHIITVVDAPVKVVVEPPKAPAAKPAIAAPATPATPAIPATPAVAPTSAMSATPATAATPAAEATPTTEATPPAAATAATPAEPATPAIPAAPALVGVAPISSADASAPVINEANLNLGHDWTYTQAVDGSYWRLRKTGGTSPSLWGAGIALGLSSWVIALLTNGYAPVVGGFISAAYYDDGSTKVLCVLNGLVGVGSVAMVIIGLTSGSKRIERQPVKIVPVAFAGGGQGAALSARF